jgi:hypothetical protein
MRTVIVRIIVSIFCFAIVAQGQTNPSENGRRLEGSPQSFIVRQNHELKTNSGERDYLLPGEGFSNKAMKANRSIKTSVNGVISSGFPAESIVQYTSFTFGTTFSLYVFSGKYVSYLMADTMIGGEGLSRDEIRELVDLTDVLYAHMAEIVGGEPSGAGLLTIALLNPGRDFGGKGMVSSKGVEMYEGYALTYRKDFLAGCVPVPVVHEMSHNFDIYNAYISHDGNNYHAWTAFLIPYVQYYTQAGASWGGRVVNPAAVLNQSVDLDTDPWDAGATTASWNDCVRTGNGCPDRGIYANESWGGLVLRYARLHGATAMKNAFRFVADYKAAHPTPPGTAEAKNDVLVAALAAGADADVACELMVWNWPVSAGTASQMRTDFPNQNSFCADADNDDHSPAQGDRDDFNAAIRPGTTEAINGLDDDCDILVDDALVNEVEDVPADIHRASPVAIPGHVIGHTTTADDSDSYQIEIDTPRSINIWAKGLERDFTGWFELRYAGDADETQFAYLPSGFPAGTVVPFDRAGTWIITVRPWSGAGEGYEIFLSDVDSRLAPELQVIGIPKAGSALVNVTSDKLSFSIQPTKVRIWAEGIGFIAQQRFESTTVFKLKLPVNANTRLRAQLLHEDTPVSNATKPVTAGWRRMPGPALIFKSTNAAPTVPTAARSKSDSPSQKSKQLSGMIGSHNSRHAKFE